MKTLHTPKMKMPGGKARLTGSRPHMRRQKMSVEGHTAFAPPKNMAFPSTPGGGMASRKRLPWAAALLTLARLRPTMRARRLPCRLLDRRDKSNGGLFPELQPMTPIASPLSLAQAGDTYQKMQALTPLEIGTAQLNYDKARQMAPIDVQQAQTTLDQSRLNLDTANKRRRTGSRPRGSSPTPTRGRTRAAFLPTRRARHKRLTRPMQRTCGTRRCRTPRTRAFRTQSSTSAIIASSSRRAG